MLVSKAWTGIDATQSLLIYVKSHDRVSRDTVYHYLKEFLRVFGIDRNIIITGQETRTS